jgi:hypothetical protein
MILLMWNKRKRSQEKLMNITAKGMKWLAIGLLLVAGFIHFYDGPDGYEEQVYKGILFFLSGFGTLLASYWIYTGHEKDYGWHLGALVSACVFFGYIISRTLGLPGIPPDEWMEPIGILSLIVEGGYLILYGWLMSTAKSPAPPARA